MAESQWLAARCWSKVEGSEFEANDGGVVGGLLNEDGRVTVRDSLFRANEDGGLLSLRRSAGAVVSTRLVRILIDRNAVNYRRI